jgi:ribosomal protein S18 acetylase RimI-like enzyme
VLSKQLSVRIAHRARYSPRIFIRQIERELADPLSIFLLAYQDKRPVGYARLSVGRKPDFVESPDPIELVRIYVETNLIGSGYGSALMQACLEAAQRAGYRSIWLGVWERNVRAIKFYEKWGFKKLGDQEFILGKDIQNDWVMGRSLELIPRPRPLEPEIR